MGAHLWVNDAACALFAVMAMMVNPGLAQDLASVPTVKLLTVETVFSIGAL